MGRVDDAEQACREALALWENSPLEGSQNAGDDHDQTWMAAMLRSQAGVMAARPEPHRNLKRALEMVQKAVEMEPTNGGALDLWNRICLTYYGSHDWNGAEVDGRLGIELAGSGRRSFFAPLLLLAGKSAENEKFCREAVRKLSDDTSPRALEDVIRLCLLHPDAAGLADESIDMAEELADRGDWVRLELAGMAYCRAGDYERAVELLEKARQRAPAPDYLVGPTIIWPDLAIVYHHLGRERDALKCLDEATPLLDRALSVGESNGAQRMRLVVLRREAESLILGDEAKDGSNAP
jgi:tetratricopeptide (TPR) repeat protein